MGDKGAMSSDKAVEEAVRAGCGIMTGVCACRGQGDNCDTANAIRAALSHYAKSLAQDGWRDIAELPADADMRDDEQMPQAWVWNPNWRVLFSVPFVATLYPSGTFDDLRFQVGALIQPSRYLPIKTIPAAPKDPS